MTEPRISQRIIQHVRDFRLLPQIIGWMGETNEKLLVIIVDICKHIVERCGEQKSFFISLNGPQRLLSIIETAKYENTITRAAKLLYYFANCDPKRVVEMGALRVLHIHLDRSSQRLIRVLLSCIRDLSDVPVKGHDVTPLLMKLLQLLGMRDRRVEVIK